MRPLKTMARYSIPPHPPSLCTGGAPSSSTLPWRRRSMSATTTAPSTCAPPLPAPRFDHRSTGVAGRITDLVGTWRRDGEGDRQNMDGLGLHLLKKLFLDDILMAGYEILMSCIRHGEHYLFKDTSTALKTHLRRERQQM